MTPPPRQPIAVSDIFVYICLISFRSKSKGQLNERRAGLSTPSPPHCCMVVLCKDLVLNHVRGSRSYLRRRGRKPSHWPVFTAKMQRCRAARVWTVSPLFTKTGQIAALWWLQGFSHDNKNCINTWKSISLYNMSKSWKKFLCISNFALWLSLPVLIYHCTQKHTYYQLLAHLKYFDCFRQLINPLPILFHLAFKISCTRAWNK